MGRILRLGKGAEPTMAESDGGHPGDRFPPATRSGQDVAPEALNPSAHHSMSRANNPLVGWTVDRAGIESVGRGLQRPECILAERDGTLWSADARGGVVRLRHDGTQQIVTQRLSEHFAAADSEATRYLTGTLPN